jgi:hypothetical protein
MIAFVVDEQLLLPLSLELLNSLSQFSDIVFDRSKIALSF